MLAVRTMKIFWTRKSIPEFKDLLAEDVGALWSRNIWKTFRHISSWISFLAFIVLAWTGHRYLRDIPLWLGLPALLIVWILGYSIWFQTAAHNIRPYLRADLSLREEIRKRHSDISGQPRVRGYSGPVTGR